MNPRVPTESNPERRAEAGACDPPARFSDPQREWTAVRQDCGLLDARFRALLRLTGADRVSFLQGMLTNDVAGLTPGDGTAAALLTVQGKLVSDLRVFALDAEMWIEMPAHRAAAVREALERLIIADDVEFAEPDAWAPLVALEGPQAARVLLAVTGESLDTAPAYSHRELPFEGLRLRAAAVSHTGESGYLLCGPPAIAATLWDRCRAAGAEPVGMETLDVLRLEAGIPWYGKDMDESMLIAEVGLDAAISFRKGCYLGQEVVERVAARGQVHRKLVGLLCEGTDVPPADSTILSEEKEAGRITSAAWSPARHAVIALGYVRREHWDPGSPLRIATAGGTIPARVTALPFYTRP